MIDKPLAFKEALKFLKQKKEIPHKQWLWKMWIQEEEEVKLRSFWSAHVESVRFLQRARDFLTDFLSKKKEEVVGEDGVIRRGLKAGGRADFVRRMREFMVAEGMSSREEMQRGLNERDVQDLRSQSRLRLIFDTNIRQAYGYGQWKQGQTPAIVKRFPAWRLVRDREVVMPRPRHEAHEGEVRLKSDRAFWADFINGEDIGGFLVPWPPFGFNSGMGVRDVTLEEAQALGLHPEKEELTSQQMGFNDKLKSSTKGLDPDLKKRLVSELKERLKHHQRRGSIEERAKQAALRAIEDQEKEELLLKRESVDHS